MSKIISKKELEQQILKQRFESEVTPMITDTTELLLAFNSYFKPTCEQIGMLIGVDNFKGGFDEIPKLYEFILKLDTTTTEGLQKLLTAHTLAIKWEASDSYCKHESNKLRWKPAEWWKFCWQQAEENAAEQ